jgi:hypothetical protein
MENKWEIIPLDVDEIDVPILEIWCDDHQFGELVDTGDGVHLEIFNSPEGETWPVGLEGLLGALQDAQKKLASAK